MTIKWNLAAAGRVQRMLVKNMTFPHGNQIIRCAADTIPAFRDLGKSMDHAQLDLDVNRLYNTLNYMDNPITPEVILPSCFLGRG